MRTEISIRTMTKTIRIYCEQIAWTRFVKLKMNYCFGGALAFCRHVSDDDKLHTCGCDEAFRRRNGEKLMRRICILIDPKQNHGICVSIDYIVRRTAQWRRKEKSSQIEVHFYAIRYVHHNVWQARGDDVTMHDESKFVLDESGKLLIEPYMEELPDLFVSYFKAILMVGHEIPRLEYYMSLGETISEFNRIELIKWNGNHFQANGYRRTHSIDYHIHRRFDLGSNSILFFLAQTQTLSNICFFRFTDKHQFGHLHTINENHIDMLELYGAIRRIVAANQMGPTIYLYPIYLYYSSLLSDQIKAMTERIFQQTIIPNLPVNIFWVFCLCLCDGICSLFIAEQRQWLDLNRDFQEHFSSFFNRFELVVTFFDVQAYTIHVFIFIY